MSNDKINTKEILWFEEIDKNSLLEAGGKGANLGVITKLKLPIPPGFVVTSSVYRSHIESNGLFEKIDQRLKGIEVYDLKNIEKASKDIMDWINSAPIPIKVQNAVSEAYGKLSEKLTDEPYNSKSIPVAVRSSATAEDLPSASFAGQQETFLNICGEESILNSMRKCFSSLWTVQAISYRSSMNFNHMDVSLAVVIQAMIPAETAGVMFTADPLTGNRSRLIITASYGLGEAVVSGLVTPDTYTISKDGRIIDKKLGSKDKKILPCGNGTTKQDVPEKERRVYCIDKETLISLAKLGVKVQEHYKTPQDIEWALYKGQLYLLQARPITTLGDVNYSIVPKEIYINTGREAKEVVDTLDYVPEPLRPLDFATYCSTDKSKFMFFKEVGIKEPEFSTRPIERKDGRIAIEQSVPGLSISMLWKLPLRLRKEMKTDCNFSWKKLEEVIDDNQKNAEKAVESIQSKEELAHCITQLWEEREPEFAKRFSIVMLNMLSYLFLKRWIIKVAGKDSAAELENRLMRGIPFKTAVMNRDIIKLAKAASNNGKDSKSFKDTFASFMSKWGYRPAEGVVTTPSRPTWQEKPETLMNLIDTFLEDKDALLNDLEDMEKLDFEAAKAEVEASLSIRAKRKFQKHLDRCRNIVLIREDSLVKFEYGVAFMRKVLLRLGAMLKADGIISEQEDIFFLLLSELVPVSEGKLNIKESIEIRKKAFDKIAEAHEKGIPWIVSTGSVSPEALKRKKKPGKYKVKEEEGIIHGIAGSRGEVIGRACVVTGPEDFNKLKRGDILVATFTAPMWTPLFRICSAVITDVGSTISHAAIVAREYGIPAVMATGNATTRIKDGQRICVDGTNGVVTIISKN
jgi:rifampicin phosphotransferase